MERKQSDTEAFEAVITNKYREHPGRLAPGVQGTGRAGKDFKGE